MTCAYVVPLAGAALFTVFGGAAMAALDELRFVLAPGMIAFLRRDEPDIWHVAGLVGVLQRQVSRRAKVFDAISFGNLYGM